MSGSIDSVDSGVREITPGHSRARRLGHGAVWSGVNTLVTKLAGIAVTIVVVRIVSPHDFGVFAVALMIYTVASSFGELGLSACIARRDLEPEVVAPVVTALSLASSSALAATMMLLASPLAEWLGAREADSAIRVLALSIFLSAFTTVPAAQLVRDFRQGRLFASTMIAFVPANAVLVLLALNGDGAMAFAWSRVVGQIVAGVVVIAATRPWHRPGWDLAQARNVLRFGLPLAGANLLNYTLLNADYAFVGKFLGPALLGTYTLAFNVASWSTSVLGATVNGVAMPAFSGMRGDQELLRDCVQRWLRLVGLVAFPVGAVTVVLSSDIIDVLYGAKWREAAPALAVLALYGAIFVVSLLLSNLLVGVGRTVRVFAIQAIWLAFLIPAVGFGVSLIGIVGAAYAHVIVIALVVVPLYLWMLRPVMPGMAGMLVRTTAHPACAALLAGTSAYVATMAVPAGLPRLAVGGSVALAVYLLSVLPFVKTHFPAAICAIRTALAFLNPSRVVARMTGLTLRTRP